MRELARQATIGAYALRFAGLAVMRPVPYEGDFDFQGVANSVPIPKTTALTEHQACWNKLYKMFDEEWNQSIPTNTRRAR
jgi:hypothetical protein